jgi:hypothetical protein
MTENEIRKSIRLSKRQYNRNITTEEMIKKYLGIEFGSYIVITYLGRLQKGISQYERYYFEKECKFCGTISQCTPSEIDNMIKTQTRCNYCKETVNIHTKEKKCAKCQTWYPATSEFFSLSKNKPLEVDSYCKTCHLEKGRKYRENPEARKKESNYSTMRYRTDSFHKMKVNLRCRVKMALKEKGWTKRSRTGELLGTDYKTVENHITSKFQEGMNWDNHGLHGWHIDHIIPLASAKTTEELESLCHYTNLQPLWAFDNISKGGR